MAANDRSNVEVTLESYERGIDAYLAGSPSAPSDAYARFRQAVVKLLPSNAQMLELGSGPGYDAAFFESAGIHVQRTDGAQGFVDHLRATGCRAELLDISTDEYGGPVDVVFANAVLLHLTPAQLDLALARAARAVHLEGLLAFTVKEGDDDGRSVAKLARPRYFKYWREPALQERLAAAGWRPLSIDHVDGRLEPWLFAICRRSR